MIQVQEHLTFDSWRSRAREFLSAEVAPAEIRWSQSNYEQAGFDLGDQGLGQHRKTLMLQTKDFKISRDFLELARRVACARDEKRWDLLYRLLYRLKFENPHLLKVSIDPDVLRSQHLIKSVGRDIHKMHAFVRFKKVEIDGVESYYAWHKPEHYIVKEAAPFFKRRFGDRPWSIFTPDLSAHWDLEELTYSEGLPQSQFPYEDAMDEIWKSYYRSIFNPARIKLKMMASEMAPKYWSSLPEAEIIRELVRDAPARLTRMAEMQTQIADVPKNLSFDEIRLKAHNCHACPLAQAATQTVFGVGPTDAKIMIVGEQPGDHEDLSGLPFTGPAGEILNKALSQAGLPRSEIYLTNAVKHFKFERQGQLRKHKKASGAEMQACRPWLEAEIEKVNPQILILLGLTAGTSVLGRLPKLAEERGQVLKVKNRLVILSWHPSAILRSTSDLERERREQELVSDLRLALRPH